MSEEMRYTDKIFLVDSPKRTRGFYDELFKNAIQQTRAEVLAAVLAKMDGPFLGRADLYRAIQNLQPAAKDLEELLKKAHRDGHACTSSLQAKEGRMVKLYSCGVQEPIGLEKARAEGKG